MKSFQSFRLDATNQCLWRGQKRVPIPPKAYDVLRYLVENPGRLITQDEGLEKCGLRPMSTRKFSEDTFWTSEKSSMTGPISLNLSKPLPKRGYRFIAPVIDESATARPEPASKKEIVSETAAQSRSNLLVPIISRSSQSSQSSA
jgi:DNA-binding winged helix-turn-helix (wHTH) protein